MGYWRALSDKWMINDQWVICEWSMANKSVLQANDHNFLLLQYYFYGTCLQSFYCKMRVDSLLTEFCWWQFELHTWCCAQQTGGWCTWHLNSISIVWCNRIVMWMWITVVTWWQEDLGSRLSLCSRDRRLCWLVVDQAPPWWKLFLVNLEIFSDCTVVSCNIIQVALSWIIPDIIFVLCS